MNQDRMPFVESLEIYKQQHMIPFHTPGHKIGVAAPDRLKAWMGDSLAYDLGLMYAIDDYHEPERELKEAQQLAAHLWGAKETWFSINGTSGAIHMMIMSVVGEGDTIIIPREAHSSVHHGLVLSGAKPVYMPCRFHSRWGIPLGVCPEDAIATMDAHKEAKAILLVYPNYYGVAVDLERIVKEAHKRGMVVLVDEAHGPHLQPSLGMPKSALDCGADLVAQSTHKLLGSLTQTSMLHGQGEYIDYGKIRQLQHILMSTSPNYIFLASLDMARHQWAMSGMAEMERVLRLARTLRQKLRTIKGISCPEKEDIEGSFSFDETKILIDCKDLGMSATDFERALRDKKIEVELVKAHHVLLLLTIGDTEASIHAVYEAVRHISETHVGNDSYREQTDRYDETLPTLEVVYTPRQAFYGSKKVIPFSESIGKICGETITYYPPGIPCISSGERISEEVYRYIQNKINTSYKPNGPKDRSLQTILICEE